MRCATKKGRQMCVLRSHYSYGGDTHVIRWKLTYVKVTVALGAFVSLVVASGAGMRWH